ncbi:MAG: Ig-like domain-containing protein [Clostridia bacterium]|nr:Ig-like domain-containing protein [Clostridia bacterium]
MKRTLSMLLAAMLAFCCLCFTGPRSRAASVFPKKDADEIQLFPAEMRLPMFSSSSGERLRVFVGGVAAPAAYFSWESDDESVVTVGADGSLTAIAPGTAVVTVTDDDGGTASSVVNVVEDAEFATLADLDFTDLTLPYYSEEVGIGPLCGGQPVILKRLIIPPSCGDEPEPDPNAYIASQGWTYTYATVFRIHVTYGQHLHFAAGPSPAGGAANAYVCLYDRYFNLWSYSSGTYTNPFGEVALDSYEDGDFFLVIMPISHTAEGSSGSIRLYAFDEESPFAMGDVDTDHYVTSSDALMLLRGALDLIQLSPASASVADMNGDGHTGSDDALLILRRVLGLNAPGPKKP